MGPTIVDGSLQGLGRGGGNAPTEQLSIGLKRSGYVDTTDFYGLMEAGAKYIEPLLPQKGLNPIDLVSGFALFHSSYMPLIRKYSEKYCVDPRDLIVNVSEKELVDVSVLLLP